MIEIAHDLAPRNHTQSITQSTRAPRVLRRNHIRHGQSPLQPRARITGITQRSTGNNNPQHIAIFQGRSSRRIVRDHAHQHKAPTIPAHIP